MKKCDIKKGGIVFRLSLFFFILIVGSVSAFSVNISYPSNNTNYSQAISSLNYTISGSGSNSCWYSNSSGTWNSTAVTAGQNFSVSAVNGENNWGVYCSNVTAAPEGYYPNPQQSYYGTGVSLYSWHFTINGVNASTGDKIIVYNLSTGAVVGRFTVDDDEGIYGYMPVHGANGDVVNFSVIDVSTNFMYNLSINYTLSGVSMQFSSVEFDFGDVNCSSCVENSTSVTFNQDTLLPIPTIIYPVNQNYLVNVSELNYTFTEVNPNKCWYSNSSGTWNSSVVDCGTNFTDVVSKEGWNNWTLYMNDTFGNLNSTNITFFKDTTYPLISFGSGTENNATNFSRNWIYVNTSWTEENFVNITFTIYNDTNIINSTTYTAATYSINFTSLMDGNYSFEVNITDLLNNQNSTGLRETILDDTPPTADIIFPVDGATYNYNNISINYTVSDNLVGLSSCWYINDSEVTNYSITCNQIFTQNLSDGLYTYTIYVNDTLNNIGNHSHTFGISTTAPAIILDSPSNNNWSNNGTNSYFNFTATDLDELDTCELWANWTGTWHKNYTWSSPTNATMEFTIANLTEGSYIWNVWCNDSLGLGTFSAVNRTIGIDATYPQFSSYWDNTEALTESGIGLFNITVTNTNGTVWLEINNTNITATNLTTNTYNVSYNFTTNGTYFYKWHSWGNGALYNYNVSTTRSYTVNVAEEAEDGGEDTGGGGSGGGGGDSGLWLLTYPTLNSTQFNEGYNQELANRSRVGFKIGNETHYAGIIEINNISQTATINVSSDPQIKTLGIGEEWMVELDGNGYYDVLVKLNSIINNKANLNIKSISNESIQVEEENNENIAGADSEKDASENGESSRIWLWTIFVAVAMIVTIYVVWVLYKKRRRFYSR